MTVTGLADSRFGCLMREPVTTIGAPMSAAPSSAGASCAIAGVAMAKRPTPSTNGAAPRFNAERWVFFTVQSLATEWLGYPGIRCEERSEEPTSELQSLMRISYAVLCLKKKNTQKQHN